MSPKLHIIAGKGGVGRSTVAAGLAVAAAAAGKRVLVVDAINDGGLRFCLESAGPIPFNIELLELDTVSALDEYLKLYLKFPIPPSRLGPIARIFEYVATAAPGVTEILTIGKIGFETRDGPWDIVVVDAPATGHVVELLAGPDNLADLISLGPLAEQTKWLSVLLRDPDQAAVWITSTPEELPVSEAADLLGRIRSETGVHVVGAVLNRVPALMLPQPMIAATGVLATAVDLVTDRSLRADAERSRFLTMFDTQLPDGIFMEIPEAEDPLAAATAVWSATLMDGGLTPVHQVSAQGNLDDEGVEDGEPSR